MKTKRIVKPASCMIICCLMFIMAITVSVMANSTTNKEATVTSAPKLDDPPPCFTVDRSRPEWLGTSTAVTDPPVESVDSQLPTEFALEQNIPNPFNPSTTIAFAVKEKCRVTLKVYDIMGREVLSLVDQDYAPGFHQVVLDANRLPSGTYLYRIRMKDFHAVKKMVLLE